MEEAFSIAAIRLSVCLSHATSSTTVHFGAMAIEH